MVGKWLLTLLVLIGWVGCTSDEPSSTAAPLPPKPEAKKPRAESWKEVATPVPVGKKLACADLLALDKIGDALGKKLEIVDESKRDPEATSVCKLMVAKSQPKSLPTNKITVANGEELATVTLSCWAVFTVPGVKQKCLDGGEDVDPGLGSLGCVRKVTAGDSHSRYIVTVLEPD